MMPVRWYSGYPCHFTPLRPGFESLLWLCVQSLCALPVLSPRSGYSDLPPHSKNMLRLELPNCPQVSHAGLFHALYLCQDRLQTPAALQVCRTSRYRKQMDRQKNGRMDTSQCEVGVRAITAQLTTPVVCVSMIILGQLRLRDKKELFYNMTSSHFTGQLAAQFHIFRFYFLTCQVLHFDTIV